MQGTTAIYADETFNQSLSLSFGGLRIELIAAGSYYTPGDALIWLPKTHVVFTGDMVYQERMHGIGAMSDLKNWIPAFEAMASLKPIHIIPGHGNP